MIPPMEKKMEQEEREARTSPGATEEERDTWANEQVMD